MAIDETPPDETPVDETPPDETPADARFVAACAVWDRRVEASEQFGGRLREWLEAEGFTLRELLPLGWNDGNGGWALSRGGDRVLFTVEVYMPGHDPRDPKLGTKWEPTVKEVVDELLASPETDAVTGETVAGTE